METETATLQRISELWNALKSEVRKLPDAAPWKPTIDGVEKRIKETGDGILLRYQSQNETRSRRRSPFGTYTDVGTDSKSNAREKDKVNLSQEISRNAAATTPTLRSRSKQQTLLSEFQTDRFHDHDGEPMEISPQPETTATPQRVLSVSKSHVSSVMPREQSSGAAVEADARQSSFHRVAVTQPAPTSASHTLRDSTPINASNVSSTPKTWPSISRVTQPSTASPLRKDTAVAAAISGSRTGTRQETRLEPTRETRQEASSPHRMWNTDKSPPPGPMAKVPSRATAESSTVRDMDKVSRPAPHRGRVEEPSKLRSVGSVSSDSVRLLQSMGRSQAASLKDTELDRLTSKPAPRPKVAAAKQAVGRRNSEASAAPFSLSLPLPARSGDLSPELQRRANSTLSQMSKAVQFDTSDSDGDSDLISQRRARLRRRMNNDRAFYRQDGSKVAATQPEPDDDSLLSDELFGPSDSTDAIMQTRFFTLNEGMDEYLRCTLRDACSCKRLWCGPPAEYKVDLDRLFVQLGLDPAELPPTPPPAQSPATVSLTNTHLSLDQDSDDEDDDAIILDTRRRQRRVTSPVPTKERLPASKKRKKSSVTKKAKSRRRRLDSTFPFIAGERSATYTGNYRHYVSEEEESMEDDMYQVEIIQDMMQDAADQKYYFYVKWKDYDDKDNTWEPEENLQVGDHHLRIEYLKQLHDSKLKVSRMIQKDITYEWHEVRFPGPYCQEFNDYMKSFVVGEKAKRQSGMMDLFFVQAKRWIHPPVAG